MKKVINTAIIIIVIILILGCGHFFVNYQSTKTLLENSLKDMNKQAQEIADLQKGLEEKEATMQGQQEYILELTQERDILAGFQDDVADEASDTENEDNSFQDAYPELYAQAEYDKRFSEEENTNKTAYLTFDDGPSSLTPEVLDLLDQYHAKATFFVVYSEDEQYTDYLSEIVARGHTLALHSYSHDYDKIYASVDAFLEDFEKVYHWVYEETGQRPTLFRFPGGSTNGKKAITDEIVKEMQRRGFIYYDWNVSSGDGSTLTTTENIIENICTTINTQKFPVVLMHDGTGKYPTLKALPTVLESLQNMGYSFDALNETMTPIQYKRN